ncbi:MAG: TRAP transporter substrate-binding protein DctP, partial [Atribacterota bacterium]|nr:TRAP transporter substrate-binding protein DctP [Atribacterota bacterium]
QLGTIDMGVITNGPIANFLPEMAVFEMPFLFGTPEEAYHILDCEIGQDVLGRLSDIRMHGLAFSERGFRNLTNSVRPVKTASDIKGLKIRLMESPLYVDTFKALGANAVPMAWTECLTALSQGTIDGQENPIVVVYSFKLYESQDYMTIDRHTYAPATIMTSDKLWQSLTEEEQAIFEEAAKLGAQAARDYNNNNEAEQLQFVKDKGMIVEENPDLDTFREAVKPVYEKYGSQFGSLLEEIQESLAEYRN